MLASAVDILQSEKNLKILWMEKDSRTQSSPCFAVVSPRKKMIISLEGNIGSGKTTLLEKIRPHLPENVEIVLEPVARFSTYKDTWNPLELFYNNPKRTAFFVQLHIIQEQIKYYEEILQNSQADILLCERSLWSPIIFTNALSNRLYLNPFEADKLNDLCHNAIKKLTPGKPLGLDHIFFMKTPTSVCLERIKQRNRPGESSICPLYLQELDYLFHKFFDEFVPTHLGNKILLRSVEHAEEKPEEKLLNFIKKIQSLQK